MRDSRSHVSELKVSKSNAAPLSELLAELRNRDVRLWAEGDKLRFNAPDGVFTPVSYTHLTLPTKVTV